MSARAMIINVIFITGSDINVTNIALRPNTLCPMCDIEIFMADLSLVVKGSPLLETNITIN